MMDSIWQGLVGSFIAGMGTTVGALPVLLPISVSKLTQGLLLGLGGGMMLAATSFSLIVPGTEAAMDLGYGAPLAAGVMVLGVLAGGALLWTANRYFPHEHFFKGQEGPEAIHLQRLWLFVIAIAIHNFPEGLAVGVGYAGTASASATSLAAGIGLQNMPEGLVVAIVLRELSYSPVKSLAVAALTGLVEPVGGLVGAAVVSTTQGLLPWGMAVAAGAMLFVIVDEIIPDVNQKALGQSGTLGLMGGFVTMMFIDIALG